MRMCTAGCACEWGCTRMGVWMGVHMDGDGYVGGRSLSNNAGWGG